MQLKSDILPVLRLLANQRYGLDVYQRGYVWSDRELTHFLTDLEDYAIDWASDPSPPPWFLGSVIIEKRADRAFLVDGQQRLVTLGLLLGALHPHADKNHRREIELALGGGSQALALPVAVGRYQIVFAALAAGEAVTPLTEWDDDQKRIAQAYLRIQEWIAAADPEDDYAVLIDGVLRRCCFNVVTVTETELAYRLFNSLNARGKPLTTVETLKGVLFIGMEDGERAQLSQEWDRAHALASAGGQADVNPTLDALKIALIARHAAPDAFMPKPGLSHDLKTIRDNPFEWLMGAEDGRPPTDQIGAELPFYLRLYGRLTDAVQAPRGGGEAIHFITECGLAIDQWAPALMAPLTPRYGDPDDNARKAAAVLAFLDIVAARIAWRPGWMTPAGVRDHLTAIVPQLRDRPVEDLAYQLATLLEEHFADPMEPHARLHIGPGGVARRGAHALLARLTAYVETYSALPEGDYAAFVKPGPDGFAMEHLVAAPEKKRGKASPADERLASLRDVFGALVLIPERLASHLGGAPTAERFDTYGDARNVLAALLNSSSAGGPGAGVEALNVALGPYPDGFSSEHVGERQAAYAALAQQIWRTDNIMEAAGDPSVRLVKLLGFDRAD